MNFFKFRFISVVLLASILLQHGSFFATNKPAHITNVTGITNATNITSIKSVAFKQQVTLALKKFYENKYVFWPVATVVSAASVVGLVYVALALKNWLSDQNGSGGGYVGIDWNSEDKKKKRDEIVSGPNGEGEKVKEDGPKKPIIENVEKKEYKIESKPEEKKEENLVSDKKVEKDEINKDEVKPVEVKKKEIVEPKKEEFVEPIVVQAPGDKTENKSKQDGEQESGRFVSVEEMKKELDQGGEKENSIKENDGEENDGEVSSDGDKDDFVDDISDTSSESTDESDSGSVVYKGQGIEPYSGDEQWGKGEESSYDEGDEIPDLENDSKNNISGSEVLIKRDVKAKEDKKDGPKIKGRDTLDTEELFDLLNKADEDDKQGLVKIEEKKEDLESKKEVLKNDQVKTKDLKKFLENEIELEKKEEKVGNKKDQDNTSEVDSHECEEDLDDIILYDSMEENSLGKKEKKDDDSYCCKKIDDSVSDSLQGEGTEETKKDGQSQKSRKIKHWRESSKNGKTVKLYCPDDKESFESLKRDWPSFSEREKKKYHKKLNEKQKEELDLLENKGDNKVDSEIDSEDKNKEIN